MGKRFKSVRDMVHKLSDQKYAQEFDEYSDRTRLSRILFALRNRKQVTQKDLAEKIGVSQGKISKLEHAEIQDIKMGDLLNYLNALGLSLSIWIHEKDNAVENIKYHAFEIQRHLDSLAEIAKKDEEIFEKVAAFYGEYFGNIFNLFTQRASKLPQPQAAFEAIAKFFDEVLLPLSEFPSVKERVSGEHGPSVVIGAGGVKITARVVEEEEVVYELQT